MASSSPQSSNGNGSMDVSRVLHMKEGLGEASYANNSSLQKQTMETLKHMLLASAVDFYAAETPRTLTMADLGCSSGPNALSMARSVVDAICESCRKSSQAPPDFMLYLNDLPSNDFNVVFASVPDFVTKVKECNGGGGGGAPAVFVAGVPGSFYGRLFPADSLHFVSSWNSLHWLSQVPLGLYDEEGKAINKGNVYISQTSPPSVANSYSQQFQKDFSLFLKSRSEELVNGGRLAFSMLGRRKSDHFDRCTTFLWDALSQSFAMMASQGLVEEEKVESYNIPFYAPSPREVEDEVSKEGSFAIDHLGVYELNTSSGDVEKDATIISMAIRAIQESMITHHFGGGIIETLFQCYKGLLNEEMAKEAITNAHLVVVLKKS